MSIRKSLQPIERSGKWTPKKYRRIGAMISFSLGCQEVGWLFQVHESVVSAWRAQMARGEL